MVSAAGNLLAIGPDHAFSVSTDLVDPFAFPDCWVYH
jgi:hypothetical protein